MDFYNIVYAEERDTLAVRMTVYTRPWLQLRRTTPLQFFTLLELEDVIVVSLVLWNRAEPKTQIISQ